MSTPENIEGKPREGLISITDFDLPAPGYHKPIRSEDTGEILSPDNLDDLEIQAGIRRSISRSGLIQKHKDQIVDGTVKGIAVEDYDRFIVHLAFGKPEDVSRFAFYRGEGIDLRELMEKVGSIPSKKVSERLRSLKRRPKK